jgi:hypothetical protein
LDGLSAGLRFRTGLLDKILAWIPSEGAMVPFVGSARKGLGVLAGFH